MCTGGRIKHHLIHNISRPESVILFVGYQAYGTLGREISSGKKNVRIFGAMRDVKAQVIRFIESYWDSGESLKVVTGNSGPMQKLVIEVAKEYKLETSIGSPFDTRAYYVMIYMN